MFKDGEYSIIERHGIKMIDAGGSTHPGAYHIDSSHYDIEIELFKGVLEKIETHRHPTMVEVGSFWAWWSLMFRKRFPLGKSILIEYAKPQLLCGEKNFEINGYSFTSYHAGMAISHTTQGGTRDLGDDILLQNVMKEGDISLVDILHMDIQGSELEALKSMRHLLLEGAVLHVVVATHNHLVDFDIHGSVLAFLSESGYEVATSIRNSIDDGYIHAFRK